MKAAITWLASRSGSHSLAGFITVISFKLPMNLSPHDKPLWPCWAWIMSLVVSTVEMFQRDLKVKMPIWAGARLADRKLQQIIIIAHTSLQPQANWPPQTSQQSLTCILRAATPEDSQHKAPLGWHGPPHGAPSPARHGGGASDSAFTQWIRQSYEMLYIKLNTLKVMELENSSRALHLQEVGRESWSEHKVVFLTHS